MKLFIAGATGFIGSSLLDHPKFSGHELICLIRPDSARPAPRRNTIRVHTGPVTAATLAGVDAILFLAGRAHRMNDDAADPLAENRGINRDLPLSIAAAGIEAGVPLFVYLSSVKAYGESDPTGTVVNETVDAPFPTDPYGLSKREAEEKLMTLFGTRRKEHCVIFRIPMVYGPGNKGNMLALLAKAARGSRLPLKAATGKRSMLYVENLCDAIITVCAGKQPHPSPAALYYLTDGADLTSAELYDTLVASSTGGKGTYYFPPCLLRAAGRLGSALEQLLHRHLPLNSEIVSRLFDPFRFSPDKFRQAYCWDPPFPPEAGLQKTVEWYKGGRFK